jgi:hypothetical protein
VTFGSVSGGGETIAAAWRFWPRRPRGLLSVRAPAPWGGTWGADAEAERQPFDRPGTPYSSRVTARLVAADWATSVLRWDILGGAEDRRGIGRLGMAGGGLTLATPGDRVEARIQGVTWFGASRFVTGGVSVTGRSRTEPRGVVLLGAAALQGVNAAAPLVLWPAGDTGHARPTLLRAHPVLDDGRLRVERLGRLLLQASAEAQRWWEAHPLLRAGGAVFVDAARTAARAGLPPRNDVDVGVGVRLAVAGISGFFTADVARGLHGRATALSLTYRP